MSDETKAGLLLFFVFVVCPTIEYWMDLGG